MHVRLLGSISVSGTDPDGRPVRVDGAALGGRRTHLLLAALVLEPGAADPARLAEWVWGDPPATWRVALRGLVADLRKRLTDIDGTLVATTPTGYRLAAGVGSDAADWDAAVAAAPALRRAGDWAEIVRRLVPHQYDADVAAGGLTAPWLDRHHERFAEASIQTTVLLVEAYSALGETAAAVTCARRAVAGHPLDERGHRSLILALHEAGDRAGALQAYDRCRRILAGELGTTPSDDTVAAYLLALGAPTAATEAARVRPTTTSFVGRVAELDALVDLCASPGVVVLTGVGGVGKSRLAHEVALRATDLEGGRSWVELGAVPDDALVEATAARALEVAGGDGSPASAIAATLAPGGRTLLVLDAAEAVRDGVATLAEALVAGAPDLTVLVTSRVPLGVPDERVLSIGPLADVDAQMRLLADRVHEQGGELGVDALRGPLAELCRRTGGLPLALELVAASLGAMAPDDLVDHLDIVGRAPAEALHDVLQATYQLLDPVEQLVFARLSVLRGAVGLPEIRAVVVDDEVPSVRVVRVVRELTARGLLVVRPGGSRWTYEQDDDVRRFAGAVLEQSGADAATFERLADLVAGLLPDDPRSPPAAFTEQVTAVLASVRNLFAAGVDRRADRERCLELAFRLHRYWAATDVGEGRFWLASLLEEVDPTTSAWAGYATYALGYLSYWAGDVESALPELERAIELVAEADGSYAARAGIFLAGILDDLDRGPEAVARIRQAVADAAPFGVDLRVSAAMGIGSVLAERGDPAAAAYAEEAITLCEQGGSAEQLVASLPTAAMIAWQVGDLDRARRWVDAAVPLHTDARRIARVVLHSTMCGVALAERRYDDAVVAGRTADEEGTALGVEREIPLARSLLALALAAAGDAVGARDRAGAAVEAAAALGYRFPLALALEVVALVDADRPDAADLLATAASMRARGDRPVPGTIGADVEALRHRVGAGRALDPDDAVGRAIGRIAGRASTDR